MRQLQPDKRQSVAGLFNRPIERVKADMILCHEVCNSQMKALNERMGGLGQRMGDFGAEMRGINESLRREAVKDSEKDKES